MGGRSPRASLSITHAQWEAFMISGVRCNMDSTIERDGIQIPVPSENERKAFNAWLKANNIVGPFHEEQHYDYVSAFRSKINRDKNEHFPDTYKLPGHPTFSIESQYYKPGMKAGRWEDGKYIPIPANPLLQEISELLGE
jgi:hypothetical protein